MQLHPRETFTIVRQIEDPTDPTTLYVQATIRNAKTDALLATLQLEDKGSQRFTKNWQVPADVSGQGFWISIVTTVYTDSGYSTRSPNYGEREQSWLIQQREVFNPNYPIPTGPDISYKKIESIVESVVEAKLKPLKEKKEEKRPDLEKAIRDLEDVIMRAIREKKEPQDVDLKPVVKGVNDLKAEVKSILAKVIEGNEEVVEELKEALAEAGEGSASRLTKIANDLVAKYGEINEAVKGGLKVEFVMNSLWEPKNMEQNQVRQMNSPDPKVGRVDKFLKKTN